MIDVSRIDTWIGARDRVRLAPERLAMQDPPPLFIGQVSGSSRHGSHGVHDDDYVT
jgi:hypothetical protein